MSTAAGLTARQQLANYILEHGPVPTVRVTSVTVGGLTNSPQVYWDTVRGQVQLHAGVPWHVLLDEPEPQFDTGREADEYAEWLAHAEQRLQVFYGARSLLEPECGEILRRLGQQG
jgi:hypothetical protein